MPPWRHPLLLFALTALLSVPFWVLGAASGGTLPVAGVSISIGMVICPALAATWLAHRETGRAGVRRLWSRLWDGPRRAVPRRTRRRWWAVSVCVLPIVTLLSLATTVPMAPAEAPDLSGALLTAALVALPLVPLATLEEIAWTGYATDPLQHRWGMLRASLAIGTLGAAWHVIPWWQVHGISWVLWQALFTIASRVVIVGVYNVLGGSLAPVVTLHVISNICFVAAGALYDPASMALLTTAAAAVVATGAHGPDGLVLNRRCRRGAPAPDSPQR